MIRTQISLNELEYNLAKEEASRRGMALAELFRKALRLVLPYNKDKPWMKYAGFVESGSAKSSETIDDLIYGQKD